MSGKPNAKQIQMVKDVVSELVKRGQLEEASEILENAIGRFKYLELNRFRWSLADAFTMRRNYQPAIFQYEKLVNYSMANWDQDQEETYHSLFKTFDSLRLLYNSEGLQEDHKRLLQATLKDLDGRKFGYCKARLYPYLVGELANLLLNDQNVAQAESVVHAQVERARQRYDQFKECENTVLSYAKSLEQAIQISANDENRLRALANRLSDVFAQAAQANLGSEKIARQYRWSVESLVSRSGIEDPEFALELVEKAIANLTRMYEFQEKTDYVIKIELRDLRRLQRGISNFPDIQRSVGKPAPKIDVQFWASGSEPELDGKVTIVDFFDLSLITAVINFHFLGELYCEYKSHGLKVVSISRPHNHVCIAGTTISSSKPLESNEQIKTLNTLVKDFEIPYPLGIAPETSAMYEQFQVAETPHYVLIDRKGIIRMTQAGEVRDNLTALKTMLDKLLKFDAT